MSDLVKSSNLTAEQKSLESQFNTLSLRLDEPASLTAINNTLKFNTYLLGHEMNKIDLSLFDQLLPKIKQFGKDDVASFRHILRWGDLIQNLTDTKDKFSIDLDAPVPREIKEKKKKDDKKDGAKPAEKEQKPVEKADAKKENKGEKKEMTEEEKKVKAEAAKAKKAAKAKANAEKQAAAQASQGPPTPSMVDFKVGFIQKAIKHPNADSLYVSTIDCGEEEPRTICSGLVKYIPLEDMQERYVTVVANLKPVAMRGIKSNGMVLCASAEDKVEFVNPPAGSKPGDKLFFQDFDGTPEKQLNPKKKIFETVQPLFTTTEALEVTYTEEGKEPKKLVNAKGELCKINSLVKAEVK